MTMSDETSADRAALAGHAAQLRRYGAADPPRRARFEPFAHEAAAKILELAKNLPEPTRAELAELLGWCEALVHGWIVEWHYDPSELTELVDEAFPPAVELDPEPPCTFESATVDHVVGMVILCGILMRDYSDGSMLAGNKGKGWYFFTDQSESDMAAAWDEHGVVAVGFHKYAGPAGEALTAALPGLPAELEPLAQKLEQRRGPAASVGLWITREGQRGQLEGHGEDDGSKYLRTLTSGPRKALYGSPGDWCEADRVTGELVRSLSQRIMGGGGDITDEESALLLRSGPPEADVARTAKLLASFGLNWPQAQSYRFASGLTPDEEALLRAAYDGDAGRVRELLAKGVRTDVTHRPGMFEARGLEGSTPLRIALHRRAREAVVALLDSGIDVSGKSGTPLVAGALRRDPEILRELLRRGASVRFEDGFDLLFWTARDCTLEVLKLVLDHGASFGTTPEREAKLLEQLRNIGRAEAADAIEEALRTRKTTG